MFKIDFEKEENKHKRTLSHFLEKFHASSGFQNKDVAEKLGLDKSYYSKVRLQQISPITNSIVTLKRFASLNNMSLINFISQIEEIPTSTKDKDWLVVLEKIMTDLGPHLRRALIHNRLNDILKNDKNYVENLLKCFLYTAIFIDLIKHSKWFDLCSDFILKIYNNIDINKSEDIKNIISRVKSK